MNCTVVHRGLHSAAQPACKVDFGGFRWTGVCVTEGGVVTVQPVQQRRATVSGAPSALITLSLTGSIRLTGGEKGGRDEA